MAPKTINITLVYKALGDDIRLGMVKNIESADELVASQQVVSSCSSLLGLSQPTISHHFAKLVASGILSEEKQGTQKLYRIDYDVLEAAGVDIRKIK